MDDDGLKRLSAAVLLSALRDYIALQYGTAFQRKTTLARLQGVDRHIQKKHGVKKLEGRPLEDHLKDCRDMLTRETPYHNLVGAEPENIAVALNDPERIEMLCDMMGGRE